MISEAKQQRVGRKYVFLRRIDKHGDGAMAQQSCLPRKT
jgi:hypothetical protein